MTGVAKLSHLPAILVTNSSMYQSKNVHLIFLRDQVFTDDNFSSHVLCGMVEKLQLLPNHHKRVTLLFIIILVVIGEGFDQIDTQKLKDNKVMYSLTRHGLANKGNCSKVKNYCLSHDYMGKGHLPALLCRGGLDHIVTPRLGLHSVLKRHNLPIKRHKMM